MAASSGGIRIRVTRPSSKTGRQSSDPKTKCCCAKFCHVSSMMYPTVTFYRFPEDHDRCTQWLQNAGLGNLSAAEISGEHLLCGHHFDKDQFKADDSGSGDGELKPDATPTVFREGISAKTCTLSKRPGQKTKAERTKKKRRTEDPASPHETAAGPLRVSQRKNKGVHPDRMSSDDHCYALDWDSEGEKSEEKDEEEEEKGADGKTSDPDYSPEGIAEIDENLALTTRCTVNLTRITTRNYDSDAKTGSVKGPSEKNMETNKQKPPKAKTNSGVRATDSKASPGRPTTGKKQLSPRIKHKNGDKVENQKKIVTQIRGQTIMLVPVLSQDQVGRQKQSKSGSPSPHAAGGGMAKKCDIKVQYTVPQEVQNNYNRLYSELQVIRDRQKAYRSELHKERLKATRLKKRVEALQKRLDTRNQAQSRQDITSGAAKFLAEPALSFFAHQLMRAEIKGRGMLWNDEVKTFALELYRRSPSAYQFCEEVFAMPSITRLNIWARQREAESQQDTAVAMETETAGLDVGDRQSDAGGGKTSNNDTSILLDEGTETNDTPEKEIVEQTVVVYLDGLVG